MISFPFICVIFKLVSPVERIKRCYQDMKLTENVQFGERLAGRIQRNGGRKEILAKVGEDVLVLKPCVRWYSHKISPCNLNDTPSQKEHHQAAGFL